MAHWITREKSTIVTRCCSDRRGRSIHSPCIIEPQSRDCVHLYRCKHDFVHTFGCVHCDKSVLCASSSIESLVNTCVPSLSLHSAPTISALVLTMRGPPAIVRNHCGHSFVNRIHTHIVTSQNIDVTMRDCSHTVHINASPSTWSLYTYTTCPSSTGLCRPAIRSRARKVSNRQLIHTRWPVCPYNRQYCTTRPCARAHTHTCTRDMG
jgi:hypothetical protein